jgi:hypothetical protein
MKFSFILFFAFIIVSPLSAKPLVVLEPTGKTLVRRGFENAWQLCTAGTLLKENDALRTESRAAVKIKTTAPVLFNLPENSLVETRELKTYSRAELVLLLTALELSELAPAKPQMSPPAGAFVIHGAGQAEALIDSTAVQNYLNYELNGLEALAAQGVWAGVILKIKKLEKYESLQTSETLGFYYTLACHHLGLVRRFAEAKRDYLQQFPNSPRVTEIGKLQ